MGKSKAYVYFHFPPPTLQTPDPAPSSEPEKKEFQIDLPNSKSAVSCVAGLHGVSI